MDKKLKVLIATLVALAAIGTGIKGYADLPKRVDSVEKEQTDLEKSLAEFAAQSAANIEAQKQLNVSQNAMFQQQITQQANFYKEVLKEQKDNA